MSTIPQTKYGDCSRCPAIDTMVVKIGKDLFCLQCNREIKTSKQIGKAKERDKLRGLGVKQVQAGNYDAASRQALMNDLDFAFRRIVKMTAADEFGIVTCYTCPNVGHWSMPFMQCGHFIKRGNMATRWDFRNARVQCKTCNENLEGNIKVYTERLEQEYPGLPAQLREISLEPHSYGISELKQLLTDLRAKLRMAENKQSNQ